MASTSAGMPVTGASEPLLGGSIATEVDGIGLGPLKPAVVSPQPDPSPVNHVQMSTPDLFVQYHEYFQKLHLDMQVRNRPRTIQTWTSAPALTARAPPTPLMNAVAPCERSTRARRSHSAGLGQDRRRACVTNSTSSASASSRSPSKRRTSRS